MAIREKSPFLSPFSSMDTGPAIPARHKQQLRSGGSRGLIKRKTKSFPVMLLCWKTKVFQQINSFHQQCGGSALVYSMLAHLSADEKAQSIWLYLQMFCSTCVRWSRFHSSCCTRVWWLRTRRWRTAAQRHGSPPQTCWPATRGFGHSALCGLVVIDWLPEMQKIHFWIVHLWQGWAVV